MREAHAVGVKVTQSRHTGTVPATDFQELPWLALTLLTKSRDANRSKYENRTVAMKITAQGKLAFTVFELLITILLLMVLAAVLLPVLATPHTYQRINCTNNMRQIGLSFRIWALDMGC
jgi:hypothetical protein